MLSWRAARLAQTRSRIARPATRYSAHSAVEQSVSDHHRAEFAADDGAADHAEAAERKPGDGK